MRGRALKEWREKLELTHKWVSERTGIPRSTIASYELRDNLIPEERATILRDLLRRIEHGEIKPPRRKRKKRKEGRVYCVVRWPPVRNLILTSVIAEEDLGRYKEGTIEKKTTSSPEALRLANAFNVGMAVQHFTPNGRWSQKKEVPELANEKGELNETEREELKKNIRRARAFLSAAESLALSEFAIEARPLMKKVRKCVEESYRLFYEV